MRPVSRLVVGEKEEEVELMVGEVYSIYGHHEDGDVLSIDF